MAKTVDKAESLLGGLRDSAATKRLGDEARSLLEAGTGRLTSKLGDGLTSAASKLTDIGESGKLPGLGEGAKRMLSGKGPASSAMGALKENVTDKAKGLLGGKGGGGKSGPPKAVNIEESIDIGVPVSVAYDQWTQFEDFSDFTKGVESVDQNDETEITWRAKVFKSRRSWKAKIQEQIPDRRIVWTSQGSKGETKGVVTFHPLADDLTRVLVALEYYPSGLVEKTGNLWRAAGRRTRLDLKNFRRFVMMKNEPTGSWRGEIRDGEVVKGPDEEESGDSQDSGEDGGDGAEDAVDDQAGRRPRKRSSSTSGEESSESSPARKSTRGRPRKASAEKSTARKSTPRKSSSDRSTRKSTSASSRSRSSQSSPPRKSAAKSQSSRSRSSSGGSSSDGSSSGGSSSSRSSARKSSGSSRTRKATSESRSPRKSTSRSTSPAKKSTSSRSATKKAAKKAPAKKAPAKKSSSTARKQPAKRSSARKRTSR